MRNVLVTGANGFIGRALCSRLAYDNKIIGICHRKKPIYPANIVWEQADLIDQDSVSVPAKGSGFIPVMTNWRVIWFSIMER